LPAFQLYLPFIHVHLCCMTLQRRDSYVHSKIVFVVAV
jgi:hypothetical protein